MEIRLKFILISFPYLKMSHAPELLGEGLRSQTAFLVLLMNLHLTGEVVSFQKMYVLSDCSHCHVQFLML